MSLSWAWLFLLLATFPWLLGVDLLSDAMAASGVCLFISGAAIIAPCRRLRRWQAVLFSGCVGFLFESLRPIPDGSVALLLVFVAIYLTSHRDAIRDLPKMFAAAVVVNALACSAWFIAAGLAHTKEVPLVSLHFLGQWLLHLLLATILAVLLLVPLTLVQNFAMDRIGVPQPDEAV
ncbi:MAG: hypothetical protein RL636_1803 [Verrucomicrobiota bacterium]|jgi:hypothetical protein